MIRVPFLLGLVLLGACENPAAPGTAVPDAGPLPSRKIVAASAVTDLGKPPNAKTAHAFDVNDAGGVAGYSVNNGGRARGFVWRASSGFTVLSPLSGHRDAFAFSINDNNQVVGISQTSAGLSQATMWTNGSPASLGSLVPGGASFGMAVNYWGSVAGSATIAGGATHAFYYSFLTRRMTDIGVLTGGTYSMVISTTSDRSWATGIRPPETGPSSTTR